MCQQKSQPGSTCWLWKATPTRDSKTAAETIRDRTFLWALGAHSGHFSKKWSGMENYTTSKRCSAWALDKPLLWSGVLTLIWESLKKPSQRSTSHVCSQNELKFKIFYIASEYLAYAFMFLAWLEFGSIGPTLGPNQIHRLRAFFPRLGLFPPFWAHLGSDGGQETKIPPSSDFLLSFHTCPTQPIRPFAIGFNIVLTTHFEFSKSFQLKKR